MEKILEIKKHNEVIRLFKKPNGHFFFQFGAEIDGSRKNLYELDMDKNDISEVLNSLVSNINIKSSQMSYKLNKALKNG